jgi:hypothetical protein
MSQQQVGKNFFYDLGLLGLSKDDVEKCAQSDPGGSSSFENIWKFRNECYQKMISDARKKEQLKYHPDINKDPEANEKSKIVNAAYDCLKTVLLSPPQPVFQPMPVIIFQIFSSFSRSSTTTSTCTSGWVPWGTEEF